MTLTLADVDLSNLDTFVERVPHDQFDAPAPRSAGATSTRRRTDGAGLLVHHPARRHPHDQRRTGPTTRASGRHHDHEGTTEEQLEQQRMMMLMMDPPKHTKLRLLVNKGFTPRMIGRLDEHIRDDRARDRRPASSERGECDFVVDVAAELPLQVIAEMMGVPHEDRHQLFDWSNRMIGSEDPEYAVSAEEAMERRHRDVHVRERARRQEARRTRATTSSARCCRPRSKASGSPTSSSTCSSSSSPSPATRRPAT